MMKGSERNFKSERMKNLFSTFTPEFPFGCLGIYLQGCGPDHLPRETRDNLKNLIDAYCILRRKSTVNKQYLGCVLPIFHLI